LVASELTLHRWDFEISASETDTLFNVERVQFDDGSFLLDLDQGNDKIEFIHLLYDTLYDRTPDEDGFVFWLDQHKNGLTEAQIYDNFDDSAEYASIFESGGAPVSNQAFVEILYDHAFDKAPGDDPAGIAFYKGLLDSGTSRSVVARDISQSTDHQLAQDTEYGNSWAWVDTSSSLEWL
jgi:hypothetical protein